jgi:predicted 3-demethylubiquinone-9 3-methyltransferase (glyoxalase superfamily)
MAIQTNAKLQPCLWFDGQAEEAARFYTTVFKGGTLGHISRYGEAGKELHKRPVGSVLTVEFTLEGMHFTALNGGPQFKFSEAISFQVMCENQDEVDYYWRKLAADGGQEGDCGWLKDRFGLSWQIVPRQMIEMLMDKDPVKSQRAMASMMTMQKLDIAKLKAAFDGK